MVERRVLAVDDDPAALEAIVALLQKDGFEVHTAASAEAAEELLSRFSYPLIITDLVLPGQSGIDLVRRAGERQPEAASITGCIVQVLTTTSTAKPHTAARATIHVQDRDTKVARVIGKK